MVMLIKGQKETKSQTEERVFQVKGREGKESQLFLCFRGRPRAVILTKTGEREATRLVLLTPLFHRATLVPRSGCEKDLYPSF